MVVKTIILYLNLRIEKYKTPFDYEPQNGDDVVVSINSSEYTLKRYDKLNSKLVALNPEYAHSVVINEHDEVVILGVVDALIRNKKKRK